MAQLSSPGVSVTVVDESFYTPGAPGTVPLIIVASKANKMNAAGTGIAPGTTAANAGKVWLLTSQMDLGSTFGIPYFQTDAANNPVNAGELNEYGLQAAYSFLGVSNRAYVVRADIDLSQLVAEADAPVGKAADGTLWLDTVSTNFGLFEWNSAPARVTGGQSFVTKPVTVITDTELVDTGTPKPSYGQIGQYAIVATTTLFKLWYKKPITDTAGGVWVEVGSTNWVKSRPTASATRAIASITPGVAKSFTGAITSTTLTVTSSVSNGPLVNLDLLAFVGATPNTLIRGQLTSTGSSVATVEYTSGGASGMPDFNVISPVGLVNGQLITGTGIPAGTIISVAANTVTLVNSITGNPVLLTQQAAGMYDVYTPGGIGTYRVNQTYASPVTSTTMTVSTTGQTLTINGILVGGVTTVSALATAINNSAITGVTAYADSNNYLYLYSTGDDITVSGAIANLAGWTSGQQASKTFNVPELTIAPHYTPPSYGTFDDMPRPTGSLWIKTTSVNLGANWIINKYNEEQDAWIKQSAKLFEDASTALSVLDPVGGGANLSQGALYVKYNNDEQHPALSNFKIYQRAGVGATTITSIAIKASTFAVPDNGSKSMTVSWSVPGSATKTTPVTVTFIADGAIGDAAKFVEAFQSVVQDTNILAQVNSDNTITISHLTGGEIVIDDGADEGFATMFPVASTANLYNISAVLDDVNGADSTIFVASLWTSTVDGFGFVSVSSSHPTTIPADQTLWYNSDITDVDIMVNNGSAWVGYLSANGANNYLVGGKTVVNGGVGGDDTDPNGPIVAATKPKKQSDGSPLAHGDIWVSTADIGNFPVIYKYNLVTSKWVLVDNADQTTSNGIVFADARWSGAGDDVAPDSIAKLLTYNYVDPDCPEAALYPRGTLLWNLRRSGFNVKKFVQNYIDPGELNHAYQPTGAPDAQTSYYPHRWVSAAANQLDGSGTFGTAAQRAVVLTGLLATIQENQGIRQPDTVIFNLLSCPGYLETYSALIGLNTDNGESAFIIADAPAHMTPDATTLSNWGNNTAGAANDGDVGLIATNAYSAVYYPWAYTSDLIGNFVVVPPSHVMLRTIALSDNVSYPWFAPAGVRRGGVTNASSVGYVDRNSGEFITVALNGGQRDTLAGIHVNPITYLAGTGLVVYGQKTRQLVASSLDRINVARLVIYLRYQLNVIAKPFIFEPNDTITRNEIKQQIEKLLLGLTAQRALYDFLVVCDKSNNTPARIDANELHVDIAIEPVKSVEFIYIPMRLENTGGVAGLGA